MGVGGKKGKEPGEWNGSLAGREVVALLGGVVVQVGANQPWGQATEMLFMVDKTEGMFGGIS